MKSLLEQLVSIPGPSGYENQIRSFVKDLISPFSDSVITDNLGNLIATKGIKKEGGKTILVIAHLDEIGVIVTHVDKNGFARFTNLGNYLPRNTMGGRVNFLNGAKGVIGFEPEPNRTKIPPLARQYIDLGVTSAKDCPVKIGDVGVFDRTYVEIGENIVSKALDDRIGVYALIEALKMFKQGPNQVVAMFSVQEEVGSRGAIAGAYNIESDIGFAIDVTITGDTPNANTMEVALGNGPAIKVKDTGMIADPRVVRWMEKVAIDNKIPYQLEILIGGTTDARGIQTAKGGAPAGCISIPCRYVHTPSEMVNKSDVDNTIDLLVKLFSSTIAF